MTDKTRIRKDRARRELIVERTVRAPRELVWDLWTQPAHLTRWWGPQGCTTTVYAMELRPGGVWHYCIRPGGGGTEEWWCKAVYHEVERPSRLVYTDAFSDKDGAVQPGTEMPTRVELNELSGGLTNVVIITRFPNEQALDDAEAKGMVAGFVETLDRLERLLPGADHA